MKRLLRNNGLSIVLIGFFLFALFVGQFFTGFREYNDEQEEHGEPPLSYEEYFRSDHFLEATMENWESEFLQMFVYVVLTPACFKRVRLNRRTPTIPSKKNRLSQSAHRGPCAAAAG